MSPIPAGEHTLRTWSLDDLAAVQQAASDLYIVATTTVPAGCGEDEAAEFVRRQWTRPPAGVGYSLAIADGHDRAVGQIGLWLRESDAGRAELGYWVLPAARGSGVATLALRALSDWAQGGGLHVPRLQLFVEPWNVASIRTAERAGFEREGLLRSWREVAGKRRDFLCFSRVRHS